MRLPALRSKNYRLYLTGSFFALNSFWISRVIVGWLGWELTGSASWVGLLSFFLFAPATISSPLFGVLMDRLELRRAAMTGQAIVAVTTVVLLALHATGTLTIWALCVVALVLGLTNSADRSIRMTLVPRVVDRDALPNAVALYAATFNTARLIGPAIGGGTIEIFGTDAAIVLNFLTTLPFLATLPLLSLREREARASERKPFLIELADGARHAFTHPMIREAMVLTGISSCAVRGVMEILPVIADGVFHRGAEGLGHMLAAGGAGALIAAIAIALRRSSASDARIPLSAHITVYVGFLSVALLGVTDSWLAAIAMTAIIGFAGTMIGISMQSAIQLRLDDTYRGRVMSLWMVMGVGGSAVGAIVLGTLADLFGISATLVAAGLVGAALSAAFKLLFARDGVRSPG